MATAAPSIAPTQAEVEAPPQPCSALALYLELPLRLWHLLSLDAPTVAVCWTTFIASTSHIHLPASSLVAVFLGVWTLYAADRILDARSLNSRPPNTSLDPPAALEPRHTFHHRHRAAFLCGIALAVTVLSLLLPRLPSAALHLYLIEGALLAAYFLLLHATRSGDRIPKELAVGIFFAAAVFIPTIAHSPALCPSLLAPAVLVATLCSLNCLFIHAWEHRPGSEASLRPQPHPATRFALRHLTSLTLLTIATSIVVGLTSPPSWPIAAAVTLAALLLLLLHRHSDYLHPTTLRASADLALLSPLLLLPFLR